MKKYTVTTTENLRTLCIENNWFTCGDNRQYEKLFYANENGCSIEEIATIIWLCSDDSEWRRIDILDELKAARLDFWAMWFSGVKNGRVYKIYDGFGNYQKTTFINFLLDTLSDPSKQFSYTDVSFITDCRNNIVWERDN